MKGLTEVVSLFFKIDELFVCVCARVCLMHVYMCVHDVCVSVGA